MRRTILLGCAALALAACEPSVPDDSIGFDRYDQQMRGGQSALDADLEGTASAAIDAASPAPAPQSSVSGANGISAENDFSRVSEQRSIQDDQAFIQQNRAQYQVIQPTALPSRVGGSGPNIVKYALETSNRVGESIYKRSILTTQARFDRNCASYPSSDMAQIAFLQKGGPERDRDGLDPDGDGFACAWDPKPFRLASGANKRISGR